MKNLFLIIALCGVSLLFACTQLDGPVDPTMPESSEFAGIKVGTLDTRSMSRGELATPADSTCDTVLIFDNDEVYNQTLEKLKDMSDSEKDEFFHQLGFKGAYSLLNKAIDVMDCIFDQFENDSTALKEMIELYKKEYSHTFIFNETDSSDVTPYLKFVEEELALLGNINGYVVVGENVLKPSAQQKPAYNGHYFSFDKATISIRNKYKGHKYTSEITLGRMGAYLAFRTQTYRKVLFWKVYRNSGHDGTLEIWRDNVKYVHTVKTRRGEFKLNAPAISFSPRLNMKVTDFSSELNKDYKVTKTLESILVRQ